MTPALRVFKNSFALTLSVLVERSLNFFLPWYVARVLGREVWGDFSTAYTFIVIAATLAPWGLVGLLPRHIARDHQRADSFLANASIIGFAAGIVTLLGMSVAVHLLNYPPHIETLIYIGLLFVVLPQTEATIFESVIQGLERMEWIVFIRLPGTVLRVSTTIFLLANGYGIHILFIILAIYYTLNCLFYLLIFKRFIPNFTFRPNLSETRLLFIQAIPFFIVISTTETFKQVDRIFLSKAWDADAVGIYATGTMFIQLLYMLAPALMGALFPGLSRSYLSSLERFSFLVSWFFKLLTVSIFPLMLFTISFASMMILLVFGNEYEPSIIVLQLTALGILPSFLSRLLYRATLASNNERLSVYIAIVGNVTNLLLNILLIPRFGVVGASLAAVGTILVNLVQNFWYVTQFTQFDFRRSLLLPGLCIVISGLVYVLVALYSFIWAFLLSMGVFVLALLVTGTVGRDDLVHLQLIKAR
jgi:O-antigen/teichoic acid export membrane protein